MIIIICLCISVVASKYPPICEPVTEMPTFAETDPPTSAAPTTNPPTSAAPTTNPPTLTEPTSAVPTSALPTSAVPTSAEPTTLEPTVIGPTLRRRRQIENCIELSCPKISSTL